MRNLIVGVIFTFVVLPTLLLAQRSKLVTDLSDRLHVGDTFVPPSSVQLMRGEKSKIDWKALEDKVVLLDLFETSCATCIQLMPHLQELQKKHSDIFKVFVVTPQDESTMKAFFQKNKYLKEHQVNLPVIYGDDYLRKLFPYKSIPQAILLYKGKVQAITASGFINSDNILSLYEKGVVDLPLKDDFGKGDLLVVANGSKTKIKAGVLFSGYQDGVNYQPWKFELDSITGLYKSSLYNSSMYGALLSVATKAKIKDSYMPRMDRVMWKVKDSTEYDNFDQLEEVWLLDHGISYERYDRHARPDSIQARIIIDDFKKMYGVSVYENTKRMPCLVLRKDKANSDSAVQKEGMLYSGTKALAMFLDYKGGLPPSIDEANVEVRMRIGDYQNLAELNQQLAAYGIKGVIEEREIKVLVIEECD